MKAWDQRSIREEAKDLGIDSEIFEMLNIALREHDHARREL